MSSRSKRVDRYELRDSKRLRLVLALLTLDDLKRMGIVDHFVTEMPNMQTILRRIDMCNDRAHRAHKRLIGVRAAQLQKTAIAIDELFPFDDSQHHGA